jgi:predicted porin
MNKAVMWWDDCAEENTYVVDNSYESSRFGFKGSVKINGDWSGGYKIEIEMVAAASNGVNQIDAITARGPEALPTRPDSCSCGIRTCM